MLAVLNGELTQLKAVVEIAKGIVSGKRTSIPFQREINDLLNINEDLFNEQLLRFGDEMVVQCEIWIGEKSSVAALLEALFKTYLVLKKIEEGSYESFWKKVY